MNYPITFTFKLLALGTSVFVRDAGGNLLGFVKKKKFKLKEDINFPPSRPLIGAVEVCSQMATR